MKNISDCACGILCMVLVLAGTPATHAASVATEQLLSKARSLEGRGRLDLAALAWQQTLLADPNNADALLGLAKFAKQSGKTEEASGYLERLRKVDPKNASIGHVEEMASSGRQRAGVEEAGRLAASQNFEAAMRIYRALFGNEPPAGGLAISYYETEAATPGGWEDAVAGIERLANKYPQSEEYKLSLGRLKTYRQPSRVDGMHILEGVKDDAIMVAKARAAWRQALVWSAGNAASVTSLQAYLARYPDPELAKLMARAPKTAERGDSAQPTMALDSAESGIGYGSLKAGKLSEADTHFQAALKAVPHSSSALAGLGFVRMKQEDFHGAAEYFQQALALQPKNKNVLEALATARFWEQMKAGGVALNQNETNSAVDHFKQAVAMRPANVQATESLAGAYMQQHQAALAVPLYERLIQSKSRSLDYWYGLTKASYESGSSAEALKNLKRAPTQVKEQWAKDPEHLALLSFIYADAGDLDQSKQMFQRAIAVASSSKTELPVDVQLEFAGLFLRLGRTKQATTAFEQIAAKYPGNEDAWIGAINASLQAGDSAHAYDVLQRIPQNAYAAAVAKPDFLRSLARLQTGMKRYDLAEKSLSKAADIDAAQGKQPALADQLQTADLYVQMQKNAEAEKLLRAAIEEHPADKRGWSALINLLHTEKEEKAALSELDNMPETVVAAAQADSGFVALQASVYSAAGRQKEALSLVRTVQKTLQTQQREVPADLDIQLAWLLLNARGNQSELYATLQRVGSRNDLTEGERGDLAQIWSMWTQQRAQAAIDSKDIPKAILILEAAANLLPHDARIQATLASTFMIAEEFQKSFDIYQRWDLKGARADDYRGAVGAAFAVHKNTVAAQWLDRGLKEYPNDSRLLRLAGEQAVQHRQYKLADLYFHRALAQSVSNGTTPSDENIHSEPPSSGAKPRQTERELAHLLLEASATQVSGSPTFIPPGAYADAERAPEIVVAKAENILPVSNHSDRGMDADLTDTTASTDRYSKGLRFVRVSGTIRPSVLDPGPDKAPSSDKETGGETSATLFNRAFSAGNDPVPEPAERELTEPVAPLPIAAKEFVEPNLQQQIQGEIQAIADRNTPFYQNGVNIQERTGQGGFDKLLIEEADLEASTTVADRVRLSVIAKPTYLDSGSPATMGHQGFGTSAVDGASASRTAFGIGGEVQLATPNFGLQLGLTPEQFLVHGWLGGLRWTPGGGPFTVLLDRDSLRDTKLSFAGERDPNTGRVWGGVMADRASILGNWSQGSTGYYASVGYEDLEGKTVAKNTRIDANVGSYFKVFATKTGALTVGLNLSGMHYDKNLRYFTLGQGGYFSPQQYFLVNVPVHWTGTLNRQLQYSISASLGVQHFTENASDYFPTDAARQSASGLSYAAYTNTGGNYNLDFHTIYQITPQWLAGSFFDVNNAREYRSVNAGLYLKYLFKPRPLTSDMDLPALPDWKGVSPFGLAAK